MRIAGNSSKCAINNWQISGKLLRSSFACCLGDNLRKLYIFRWILYLSRQESRKEHGKGQAIWYMVLKCYLILWAQPAQATASTTQQISLNAKTKVNEIALNLRGIFYRNIQPLGTARNWVSNCAQQRRPCCAPPPFCWPLICKRYEQA